MKLNIHIVLLMVIIQQTVLNVSTSPQSISKKTKTLVHTKIPHHTRRLHRTKLQTTHIINQNKYPQTKHIQKNHHRHRLKKRNKNRRKRNKTKRKKYKQKKKQKQKLTTEEIQQQIRYRGTYYLSFTDIDDRINMTEEEKKELASPDQKQNETEKFFNLFKKAKTKEQLEQDRNGQTLPGELNLFNVPQIELPISCKEKLDLAHQVSLAQNGSNIMDCWKEAGQKKDATFLTLPFLTAEQFAKFYFCATKNFEINKAFILPEHGLQYPEKLLSVVLFGSKKPDIGWLEYWIYLCNGKKKLPEWAYMAESPIELEDAVIGSLEKQQKQLIAREAQMKEDLIRQKAAAVQETMKKMASMDKKRRLAKTQARNRKVQIYVIDKKRLMQKYKDYQQILRRQDEKEQIRQEYLQFRRLSKIIGKKNRKYFKDLMLKKDEEKPTIDEFNSLLKIRMRGEKYQQSKQNKTSNSSNFDRRFSKVLQNIEQSVNKTNFNQSQSVQTNNTIQANSSAIVQTTNENKVLNVTENQKDNKEEKKEEKKEGDNKQVQIQPEVKKEEPKIQLNTNSAVKTTSAQQNIQNQQAQTQPQQQMIDQKKANFGEIIEGKKL